MKLGLGTVQFGLDYGISNQHGKTSLSASADILNTAKKLNIDLLDTASLYGDSEAVIGRILHDPTFQVVTKTPQFKLPKLNKEHAEILKKTFNNSINMLQVDKVYGLLIHSPDDLINDGGEYLIEALQLIKESGKANKIGVSVYNQDQIEKIIGRYEIDLIQLPLNVFDQRLIASGILKNLKQRNVEIHVRSVFLQGLLLMDLPKLPAYFGSFMSKLDNYHKSLSDCGLTPLQGAMQFIKSIEEIDYAIVGVTNSKELQEISDALNQISLSLPNWEKFCCTDERLINPINWQ